MARLGELVLEKEAQRANVGVCGDDDEEENEGSPVVMMYNIAQSDRSLTMRMMRAYACPPMLSLSFSGFIT